MNAFSAVFAPWLSNYFLLSALLLVLVLMVGWRIGQPAQRMAFARPTLAALLLLAGLCAIPGWSAVHLLTEDARGISQLPTSDLRPAPPIEQPSMPSFPPLGLEPQSALPTTPPTLSVPAKEPIDWTTLLIGAYLSGCLLTVFWHVGGGVLARRLIRAARPAPQKLQTLLKSVGQDDKRLPALSVSDCIQTPAAVGVLRPTILLPQVMVESHEDALRPILAHEIAHIRHGDLGTLAVLRVLMLLLWPQPLYWLLRRQIRRDQETLADAVAAEVTNRTDFAEQLVAWARVATKSGSTSPRLASSVGLWESPSQLKQRISILLDERFQVLRSCSRRWRVGTLVTLVSLAVGLSFVSIWPTPTLVATEQSSDRDPNEFSFGGKVDVLGIGTNGEQPQRWWDSKGKPLDKVPFRVEQTENVSPIPKRRVVFSLKDHPRDAEVSWRVLPAGGSSASGQVDLKNPDDERAGYYYVFNPNQKQKTFQLRVGVATGEWKTIATGLSSSHGIQKSGAIFSGAMPDSQGNTLVIVSENFPDSAKRVVGIDRNGIQHIAERSGSLGTGPLNQSKWKFHGLLPAYLKTCQLQARPYEWVELDALPMNPLGEKSAKNSPPTSLGNWALVETSPVLQPDINVQQSTPPKYIAHANIATPPADETSPVLQPLIGEPVEEVPQGRYYLRIGTPPEDGDSDESSKAESTTKPMAATTSKEKQQALRELQLQLYKNRKPNTFKAICLDENRQPLAGATVEVYMNNRDGEEKESQPIRVAKSNQRGEIELSDIIDVEKEFPKGIPSGRFFSRNSKLLTLVGRSAGRVPQIDADYAAEIARTGKASMWVFQPSSTLRGRVTDPAGQPVAGAKVMSGAAGALVGNVGGIHSATTDDNGEYEITDLARFDLEESRRAMAEMNKADPKTMRTAYSSTDPRGALFVKHPEFATRRAVINKIPGEVDVQLVPASSIEGHIKFSESDAGPDSLTGALVYLQREVPPPKPGEYPDPFSYQIEETKVDKNGQYRFDSLPAENYHLTADVDGWVTKGVEDVTVGVGETTTAPDIQLSSGGQVRVQLVDAETGEPFRFEKPTKGYINPQQRPRRAPVFAFRNNIVEYSPEGNCVIQVPAGRYAFSVSIPQDGRSYLVSDFPKELEKWPTFKVKEGVQIDIVIPVKVWQQPLSLPVSSVPPSDEDEEDDKAVTSFLPETPVAESTIDVKLPGRILINARLDSEMADGSKFPFGLISLEPTTGVWTKLFDLPYGVGMQTVSADGQHVFYRYYDGHSRGVLMIDTAGQAKPKHISDRSGYISCNPKGNELIISSRDLLSLLNNKEDDDEQSENADGFTLTALPTPSGHWQVNIDESTEETLKIPENWRIEGWSPDGNWLVATSWNSELSGYGELYLMRSDGSDHRKLTNQGGGCNEPQFSSDGKFVTYCRSGSDKEKGVHRSSIRIIELATRADVEVISFDNKRRAETFVGPYTWYYHPALSPDNNWLAVVYEWRKDGEDVMGREQGVLIVSRDGLQRKELKLKQGADLKNISLRPFWN